MNLRATVIASTVAHVIIISAILIAERSFNSPTAKPKNIVFIPAAPRGELPRGSVVGIGEAPCGSNPNPTANQTGRSTSRTQNVTPTPRTQTQPAPTRTPTSANQTSRHPARTPSSPITQPTRRRTTLGNTSQLSAPIRPRPQNNVADIRNQLLKGMQSSESVGVPDGTPITTGIGARGTPAGGGTGRGRVGDPNGSSVGILGGSGAGTPFWDYHLHIHDVLYAAWQQPSQFADPLRPPTVRVRLRIAKDGSLWEAKLAQSSGIREVDESVLSATQRARLNPPPSAMLGGKDFLEITVAFKLGGQG